MILLEKCLKAPSRCVITFCSVRYSLVPFSCIYQGHNFLGDALVASMGDLGDVLLLPAAEFTVGSPSWFHRLQAHNTFVYNSEFMNEMDCDLIEYAHAVGMKLSGLFSEIQSLCKVLIAENKTANFFFLTTNPSVRNVLNYPIAPLYDESVHALVKSLAKEMNPFNLHFYGVNMEPLAELLSPADIRAYRRLMKGYAARKTPLRGQDVADYIKNLSLTERGLCSGSIFSIGVGMAMAY